MPRVVWPVSTGRTQRLRSVDTGKTIMLNLHGTGRRIKRALRCCRVGDTEPARVEDLEAQLQRVAEADRVLELARAHRMYGELPAGADVQVEVQLPEPDVAARLEEERVAAPTPPVMEPQDALGDAEEQVAEPPHILEEELGLDEAALVGWPVEPDNWNLFPNVDAWVPPEPEPVVEPFGEGPDGPDGGARLRPRGQVLNEAADYFWRYLVGDRDRDLPVQLMGVVDQTSARHMTDWFRDLFWGRAKLVAIRRVRVHEDAEQGTPGLEEGDWKYDYTALVSVGGARDKLRVSLRLLARMVNFMAFRPRDTTTLAYLRSRAAQMAKEFGLSPEQLSWVIHGTVVCATMANNREVVSLRALEGQHGDEVVDWSARTSAGVLREGGAYYWVHLVLLLMVILIGVYYWVPFMRGPMGTAGRFGVSYYLKYPWATLYSGLLFFLLLTVPKYHIALAKA